MSETKTGGKKICLSEKPIPWFRVYSDTVDDDKLRLLAFEDRWHFIAILCCKAKGIIDSADALLYRRMSVRLGLSSRELEEVARRLEEVGLIDARTLQPQAWDKRQCYSDTDPTNSERQQRFRNKEKGSNALRNAKVTRTEVEVEVEVDVEVEDKTTYPRQKNVDVDVYTGEVSFPFGEPS